MVQINIHGNSSGEPSRGTGTFSGEVSDNPSRARDFEAARKAAQRPEAQRALSDYDRAERQAQRQEAQAAAAAMRRRQQEDRAWKQRDAAEARRTRELDRATREQVRSMERARREEDRRGGLDDRLQAIDRLGRRGQAAAESGSHRELRQIERTLQGIYRTSTEQLKYSSDPAKRAAVARVEDSMLAAGRRIGLGRELRAAAGRGVWTGTRGGGGLLDRVLEGSGLLSLAEMAASPIGIAAGVAGLALSAPALIAGAANSLMSGTERYTSMRRGFARISRGANINSRELQSRFYQGAEPVWWMSRFGVTPDRAIDLLSRYGVSPQSVEQAQGVVLDVSKAHYLPSMALSREQLAQFGGQLANQGVVMPGATRIPGTNDYQTGLDQWFARLQKTMETATAVGVDHSTVLASLSAAMRANSSGGAVSANAGGLMALQQRLMASGLPGGRTGEMLMSATQGFNRTVSNTGPGGSPVSNLMLMSQPGGLPKTQAQLQRLLGMNDKEFGQLMDEPGMQRLWDDYKSAPTPFKLQYLGSMLNGHPELMSKLFNSSMFGRLPGYTRDIAQSAAFGVPLSTTAAMNASTPGYNSAIVNANPLNLKFAGQPAAIGRDSRGFAKFRTQAESYAADYRQLQLYQKRDNLMTTREIVAKWAPDAPASYARDVASAVGLKPDDPVDLSDSKTAERFMAAMATHEVGSQFAAASRPQIAAGIAMATGRPQVDDGNVPTAYNEASTRVAALNDRAAQNKWENMASPLLTGPAGVGLSAMSDATFAATKSVTDFATALAEATANLKGLTGGARVVHDAPVHSPMRQTENPMTWGVPGGVPGASLLFSRPPTRP